MCIPRNVRTTAGSWVLVRSPSGQGNTGTRLVARSSIVWDKETKDRTPLEMKKPTERVA